MKIGAIVQTRMGSTRLPGKVMLDIKGKPVIQHVIERLNQSNHLDEIIIATTTLEQDAIIAEQADKNGAKYFRGSEEDVLSRYYFAARENTLDIIIRVTSDCPLIDPFVVDDLIEFYLNHDFDLVTNAGADLSNRSYPRGLDTEVFSMKILDQAYNNAVEKYQREHVTPYIYENSLKVYYYKNKVDLSKYRWTLDTKEDYKLIEEVYSHLYNGKHDFYLKDIQKLFEKYPELFTLNEMIEQKKIK